MTQPSRPVDTGPAEVARLFDVMARGEDAIAKLAQAVRTMLDAQRAQATLASLPASDIRAGLLYRAQARGGLR